MLPWIDSGLSPVVGTQVPLRLVLAGDAGDTLVWLEEWLGSVPGVAVVATLDRVSDLARVVGLLPFDACLTVVAGSRCTIPPITQAPGTVRHVPILRVRRRGQLALEMRADDETTAVTSFCSWSFVRLLQRVVDRHPGLPRATAQQGAALTSRGDSRLRPTDRR